MRPAVVSVVLARETDRVLELLGHRVNDAAKAVALGQRNRTTVMMVRRLRGTLVEDLTQSGLLLTDNIFQLGNLHADARELYHQDLGPLLILGVGERRIPREVLVALDHGLGIVVHALDALGALDIEDLDGVGLAEVRRHGHVGDGLGVERVDVQHQGLGARRAVGLVADAGEGPAGGDGGVVSEGQEALAGARGVLGERLAVDAEAGFVAELVGLFDVESEGLGSVSRDGTSKTN